jgi:hypothetical protein
MVRKVANTRDYELFSKYVDIEMLVENWCQESMDYIEEDNMFNGLKSPSLFFKRSQRKLQQSS